MRLLSVILSLLFFFSAATTCVAVAGRNLPVVELEGKAAVPSLVVLQQKKDGSNQILDQVPEEYPAAVSYFMEYIEKSLDEIDETVSGLQGKNVSAIAITYGYPDNLEINILSGKRERFVRKINPDKTLHKLRIRSAVLMVNFIKDATGNIVSNAAVGFQLFSDDIDYSSMNIAPDYDLQQGSWILIWEHTIIIKTKIYETAYTALAQTIQTVLERLFAQEEIKLIGKDGRIVISIRPAWIHILVHQGKQPAVIPEKDKCQCFKIMAPPASPVQDHNHRVPCGQPFDRSKGKSCAVLGKQLYPDCDQCK